MSASSRDTDPFEQLQWNIVSKNFPIYEDLHNVCFKYGQYTLEDILADEKVLMAHLATYDRESGEKHPPGFIPEYQLGKFLTGIHKNTKLDCEQTEQILANFRPSMTHLNHIQQKQMADFGWCKSFGENRDNLVVGQIVYVVVMVVLETGGW